MGYSVTGHSLGGFLASNLTLEYSTDMTHTFIYNAPGIGRIAGDQEPIEALAEALSPGHSVITPDVLQISNIIAGGDWISSTGEYVTPPDSIFVEGTNPGSAHKMAPLTDSLAGLSETDLVSAADAAGDADLATRYALVNLNPFTVTGISGHYNQFNTSGQIELYSETNPEGDLSEKYIEDRSKFLYYLARPDETLSNTETDIEFRDKCLGIEKEVRGGVLGVDYHEYFWGTDGSDTFRSEDDVDGDDQLYGMGGDDTLSGCGGLFGSRFLDFLRSAEVGKIYSDHGLIPEI